MLRDNLYVGCGIICAIRNLKIYVQFPCAFQKLQLEAVATPHVTN